MNDVERVEFDYAELDAAIAKEARAAAERIRGRHKRQVEAILETGRDLLVMKERLGHGHFGRWIEAELALPARTAQKYMGAATAFDGKCASVAYLPPTTLYLLSASSTPSPVRDAIVERLEAGEALAPDQIKDFVDDAKEAARKAHAEAKLKPAQKAYRKRRQRDHESEKAAIAKEERERTAQARSLVEWLGERLGDDFAEFQERYGEVDWFRFGRELKAT